MRKMLDCDFLFRGYHGCPSKCRIRIYGEAGKAPLVLATELADNPGTSITNRVELIATAIYRLLERPVQGMVFIEHYEDRAFFGGRPLFGETFARVTLTWTRCQGFIDPKWTPITKEEAKRLIGAPLDP